MRYVVARKISLSLTTVCGIDFKNTKKNWLTPKRLMSVIIIFFQNEPCYKIILMRA